MFPYSLHIRSREGECTRDHTFTMCLGCTSIANSAKLSFHLVQHLQDLDEQTRWCIQVACIMEDLKLMSVVKACHMLGVDIDNQIS